MSRNGKPESCVLIGQQSLLIQCAQKLNEKSFSIEAIVSNDPEVIKWCSDNQITNLPHDNHYYETLKSKEFDYLFSIVNLKLLAGEALKLPKKLAINFHDGPLPRYAGINTPVWAIINQEKEYGVSWHIMTEQVDEGDILKQSLFPIAPDETAFTLNMKCLEYGLNCFTELLDDIENNNLVKTQQILDKSTYFPPCKKPEAACLISFQQPAERINALTRALDFGPYTNPVGCAKIFLKDNYLLIGDSEILGTKSDDTPGTVLQIDADNAVVSTSSNDIRISRFHNHQGNTVSPADNLITGDIIHQLIQSEIDEINGIETAACKQENYWISALKQQQTLELPYARIKSESDNQSTTQTCTISLPAFIGSCSEDKANYTYAAFLIYLYRLCGKPSFDVTYEINTSDMSKRCKDLYENRLPFHVNIEENETFDSFLSKYKDRKSALSKRLFFTKDLFLREPLLKNVAHYTDSRPFPVILSDSGPSDSTTVGCTSLQTSLYIYLDEAVNTISFQYDESVFSSDDICAMQEQFLTVLDNTKNGSISVSTISTLSEKEIQSTIIDWNKTAKDYDTNACIHQVFEKQAEKTPDQVAVACNGKEYTFRELNEHANQLAYYLIKKGVKLETFVGISIGRSRQLPVVLLGVLKAGGTYVPLDPSYPRDRNQFMLEDANLAFVITDSDQPLGTDDTCIINIHNDPKELSLQDTNNPDIRVKPDNSAYVIYTSGSTGRPKGVVVEHRNVVNFFAGMDDCIEYDSPGTWLAVTSISFDISVLELFWTLTRGFTVIIYVSEDSASANMPARTKHPEKNIDYSLFYWNLASKEDTHEDKYKLLMESAKFGDTHGFSAVWTPERHFHDFGGLFPNPSVIGAALASVTKNVHIRAGSCVIPLHHPVRVAEEWSVVDNLSNGRTGVALASGWQPNDFVIKPENFADAKSILFDSMDQVRRLWRGEAVTFQGPKGDVEVKTLPRPIQENLPMWVTVAGNPETFKMAAEAGAGILTHLLGQSVEQVAEKVELYRKTWEECGHKGRGHITLMLHTLVGDASDHVKEIARGPMKNYLKSAVFLVKQAAWNFPTFKELSASTGQTLDEYFETISEEDLDTLLEFAFERYYETSGLFGTPEDCLPMVDKLKVIGIDEIACLIDYGIATPTVLVNLPYLNELRVISNKEEGSSENKRYSIGELVQKYNVTHFQCTPSMANMLLDDPETENIFKQLKTMLVGGEVLTVQLAETLFKKLGGNLINVYGPTETTIWSAYCHVKSPEGTLPIGKPIANTQIFILDDEQRPVPAGVRGEICIGGNGVVRGYLNRPEMSASRFMNIDLPEVGTYRIYRTGDYGVLNDGILEFQGRMDHQVKIRGFRIELGEIESVLNSHDSIDQSIVVLYQDQKNDPRLVAYYKLSAGMHITGTELRKYLRLALPEYMIPQQLMEIAAFPLTPNQKIDRNALPDPFASGKHERHITFPRTKTEEILAGIWKELIGVDEVGIEDNFINLGGHSILAMQALIQAKEKLGVRLGAVEVYQNTLEEIALHADQLMVHENIEKSSPSVVSRIFGKMRKPFN